MQRRAVVLCIAVLVLIASVTASVAIADPAGDGDTSSLETLPSSKEALGEATADAVPVAMPEYGSPAIAPAELEDLGRPEAEGVLQEVFGSAVEGAARALDELEIDEFRSDHVAVVAPPKDSEQASPGLLSSLLPLRTKNDEGKKELVNLDLERVDGALQPENPLVPVQIPSELSEGIAFPGTGISIDVASVEGQRTSSLAGEASAFFPNVAEDSDLVVVPTSLGAETFMQLRSPDSPLTQVFRFNLPADLRLRSSGEGGAEIVDGEGKSVLAVPAPSAVDAEGQAIPTTLEVNGNSISVSVEPTGNAAYPILADPLYERWEVGNNTAGWSPAYNPGFYAQTYGPKPGLTAEANAGATSPGNQATWQYYVPRYWNDIQEGQPAPTTYIRDMKLWNLVFMFPMESGIGGYAQYPFMQMGLWSDNKGAYVSYGYRDGGSGPATDGSFVYDLTNPDEVTDIKHGGFAIATWWSQDPYFRYVNDQQASIEVSDKDSPAFGELGSVPSWVSSSAGPTINYKVSDEGLGVRELRLAYPAAAGGTGETITPVKAIPPFATSNCTGANSAPCPRSVNNNKLLIGYNPAQIAQGENWVRIYGVDPVGHWSSVGESRIKVDRTSPELELGGTLTEQAKVGTQQASYSLSYTAKDGDEVTAAASTPVGTQGTGTGQLERPQGVAVDSSGDVWVSDKNNNKVVEYDGSGTFIRQLPSGAANGQISSPRELSIGQNGNLWVAEAGNKRVQQFTPTGAFVSKIENTSFIEPFGVAAGSDGSIWVTDNASGKVYRYAEGGGLITTFDLHQKVSPSAVPYGIGLDKQGHPWVALQGLDQVVELDPSTGAELFKFGGTGTANGQFRSPFDVEVAKSGNIFVSDALNNRVQEFKPDGGYMRQFGTEGVANNQFKEPRSLAVGPGNRLFVADAANHRADLWTHADRHVESGVVKAEVKVDGVVQQSQNPGCAAGKNCSLTGSWTMNADAFSVGKHKVEVLTTDGVGLTTTRSLEVETHGDLMSPSVALSGTMTEQATLGTTRPSYKLKVVATDPGSAEERKSGVASTTIKLNGAVVDSSSPGCTTGACSITREWAITSSAMEAKTYSVEVKAADAAGHTTTKTLSFTINRDNTTPELTVSGPIWTAPKGWVKQGMSSLTAEATDPGGYGVKQLRLLIDGSLAGESLVQACEAGGCSTAKTFSVDLTKYTGGNHEAAVLAEDGAGNIRKKYWTLRIDPTGSIGLQEMEATLEAVEDTSNANIVGIPREEPQYEGSAADLGFVQGEEEYVADGTTAPVVVERAEPTLVIETPSQAALEPVCQQTAAAPVSPPEIHEAGAQFSEAPGPEEGDTSGCRPANSFPADESLVPLEATPTGNVNPAANPSLSEEGYATLSAGTYNQVDTATKPLFDGAMTFAAIRSTESPESFSWQVNLEPDQELKLIDPTHAEVYYAGGHPAFGIAAILAHDAVGTSVPTTLAVSGNNLTLKVAHRGGSFVYPVVGGTGWQGGFRTYEVVMPPPELTQEEKEIFVGGVAPADSHTRRFASMTFGPPEVSPSSELPPALQATATGTETKRKYDFNPCFFEPAADYPEGLNGVGGEEPSTRAYTELNHFCHGFKSEDGYVSIRWSAVIHGTAHYRLGELVWIKHAPDCDQWGPHQPVLINCYADTGKSTTRINVFGQYRFEPGDYLDTTQKTCMETNGTLGTRPPKQEYGGSILRENYHRYIRVRPVSEPCPWHNLSSTDVAP